MSAHSRIAMSAIALVALSTSAACASSLPRAFTFRAVEYMQDDQREPAAQQFIAQMIVPGMPLANALGVLKKADMFCKPDKKIAGVTQCTSVTMQQTPESDLDEIWWTVSVTATPDGAVQAATVRRQVYGL